MASRNIISYSSRQKERIPINPLELCILITQGISRMDHNQYYQTRTNWNNSLWYHWLGLSHSSQSQTHTGGHFQVKWSTDAKGVVHPITRIPRLPSTRNGPRLLTLIIFMGPQTEEESSNCLNKFPIDGTETRSFRWTLSNSVFWLWGH